LEGIVGAWIDTLRDSAVSLEIGPQQTVAARLEEEFERRLADCSALAYRVALGVLHSPADAEDVAQEAFVRAYRHFDELRNRERFRGWLVRCVWRLAVDRRRSVARRERREQIAAEIGPDSPSVEDSAAGHEFQRRLDAALDALPQDLRQVLVLAAVEGYDMRETAGLLDIPEGTVRSRLHRARKLLAEKLR
jgi:RNA polymerase sigma-70 factor, ECF subfamily